MPLADELDEAVATVDRHDTFEPLAPQVGVAELAIAKCGSNEAAEVDQLVVVGLEADAADVRDDLDAVAEQHDGCLLGLRDVVADGVGDGVDGGCLRVHLIHHVQVERDADAGGVQVLLPCQGAVSEV